MKTKKAAMLCLAFCVAILSGCATLYTGKKLDAGDTFVNINRPPVMYAGVPIDDYSEMEEFVVAMSDFLLYSEYRKFRLSWNVLAIEKNLQLKRGVILVDLKEKNPNGLFYGSGKVPVSSRDARVIVLASDASIGFDAYGKIITIKEQMLSNPEHRRELYEKATPLSELPSPGIFDQKISQWRKFHTPFGNISTPWPKIVITELAKINTGYTAGERAVESRWGIYTNPIATSFSLVQSTGHTLFGSPRGWDIDSKIKDDERSLTNMLIWEARQNAIIRVYTKGG